MNQRIPIKPHLKKFVLYFMEAREPIVLDEKELLGRCVIKVLQENRQHKFDNVLSSYTERLEVVLNADMRERSPRLHRLVHINVELQKVFTESLMIWIRAQKKMGIPANEASKNFLAELKIDENEYTYDAAYKSWQRFNDLKKKKPAPDVS